MSPSPLAWQSHVTAYTFHPLVITEECVAAEKGGLMLLEEATQAGAGYDSGRRTTRAQVHINKEGFLPAFKDEFCDVFTEENCRKVL
jgi:hypothetical protein